MKKPLKKPSRIKNKSQTYIKKLADLAKKRLEIIYNKKDDGEKEFSKDTRYVLEDVYHSPKKRS